LLKTCSCLLDGGAKEGRRKVGFHLPSERIPWGPHKCFLYYIWFYLESQSIHKAPRHPLHCLWCRSPPASCEGLCTLEMGEHSSLLQQGRQTLITEWKNPAKRSLQLPATLTFNDYSKFANSNMNFLFFFFLKKASSCGPPSIQVYPYNLNTLVTFFFLQLRNLQALLGSLQLTHVEYQ